MRLPDVYHDWRIVLGLAVMLLGVGNLAVGRIRTEQYSRIIASLPDNSVDESYRSFNELDSSSNAVLEPFSSRQRRVSFATARRDFYHATFLTGYVLVIGGLLITCFGFLALIRRDARRVITNARVRQSRDGPARSL
jgi:hypothetical protein